MALGTARNPLKPLSRLIVLVASAFCFMACIPCTYLVVFVSYVLLLTCHKGRTKYLSLPPSNRPCGYYVTPLVRFNEPHTSRARFTMVLQNSYALIMNLLRRAVILGA